MNDKYFIEKIYSCCDKCQNIFLTVTKLVIELMLCLWPAAFTLVVDSNIWSSYALLSKWDVMATFLEETKQSILYWDFNIIMLSLWFLLNNVIFISKWQLLAYVRYSWYYLTLCLPGQVKLLNVNPFPARAWYSLANQVNIIPDYDLATGVTRSSAGMILIVCDEQIFIFIWDEFRQIVSQYWRNSWNANTN